MKKIQYKVVKSIKEKGYPVDRKKYHASHMDANYAEKKVFGEKAFKKSLKMDDKLPKGQLAGRNTKQGKIHVSSKVPKNMRNEVALHEYIESLHMRGKCKRCGYAKSNKVHK